MGVLVEDDDMGAGERDGHVDLLDGKGIFEKEMRVCLP